MLTLPMPTGLLLAATGVVFAAGIVRGFAGFGFSALCVAGMSLFVSPAEVVPPIFVLEVLASLTLAQLTERGAPTIYGSSTTGMDLRLAAACVGSPELALFSAATAQMARRYLIPSFVAGL